MTDFILSFGERHMPISTERATCRIHLHQDTRPCWLRFLRIYEIVPSVPDAPMSILWDAMLLGRRDEAVEIARELGVVGQWQPSSIVVDQLVDEAALRLLARDVPANALWDLDLRMSAGPNWGFALSLINDEQRERIVRPVAIFTEMTLAELSPQVVPNFQEEIRVLRNQLANVTRTVQGLQNAQKNQRFGGHLGERLGKGFGSLGGGFDDDD